MFRGFFPEPRSTKYTFSLVISVAQIKSHGIQAYSITTGYAVESSILGP